ncbi:tetratricopeptide repeat protein [Streptomyces sp. IBSBF 3136]|uniref:tetratricopeptide repeat protein n=1 Tax=Streptomyces sp. IBSBF 3136 TaxID=2903524 RepID=UPI002FDC73EC
MHDEEPMREQRVHAEPGSFVYAVMDGDIHIRRGRPVYRIDPGPRPRQTPTGDLARQQPSRLLHPGMRVVDFHGRDRDLEHLDSWRDAPQPGITVQLLHGPGGQGKTRLANEFADRTIQQEWTCWHAHYLSDPTEDDRHQVPPPGPNLLLIVDYAERWPLQDLRLLLHNPLLTTPTRCRVLLISRTADHWWQAATSRLDLPPKALASLPLHLAPPAADTAERHQIYQTAWTAFARAFQLDEPPARPQHDLDDDAFDLTLTLHMAALVAVDARARGQQPPSDPAHLSSYLLDREHDFWASLHAGATVKSPPHTVARAVHTATLTGPVAAALAHTALTRAEVAEPALIHDIVADHSTVYPPTSPTTMFTPLYPDRLGEDFIALRTPGHTHSDYLADPWAAGMPARLLGADPDTPYTRNTLTVLIETAARWDHLAHAELHPLLYSRPELALSAGGAALGRLAELSSTPLDLLEAVDGHLPDHRHPDLDPGIAILARRLLDHRLSATDDPLQQAILHHDLAVRLTRTGDWTAAVSHGTTALNLLRPLPATVGDATYTQLTRTLRNLAAHAHRVGDTTRALSLLHEALDRDRADHDHRGANTSELALSLINLAAQLHKSGRNLEALQAADEAVELLRALEADPSPKLRDWLARALNQRAIILSDLARLEEAVRDDHEALTEHRGLYSANPDAYGAQYAAALSNHGGLLRRLGRHQEAADAAAQSVDAFRLLARANPDAYTPDLAQALSNLGVRLAGIEQHDRALHAAQEAVELRRDLAQRNPLAYGYDYAVALHNLAGRLLAVGRSTDALGHAQESEERLRTLAATNPSAFQADHAVSLSVISATHAALGHAQEAIAAARESLAIEQRLARAMPQARREDLATSWGHLMILLGRNDDLEGSAQAGQSAVDLRRILAAERPEAHAEGFAHSLINLSITWSRLRRYRQARTATQEAAAVLEHLLQHDSSTRRVYRLTMLASAQAARGRYAHLIGHNDEAQHATRTALGTLRQEPDFPGRPQVQAQLLTEYLNVRRQYSEDQETAEVKAEARTLLQDASVRDTAQGQALQRILDDLDHRR